jgi:hypothetical protein
MGGKCLPGNEGGASSHSMYLLRRQWRIRDERKEKWYQLNKNNTRDKRHIQFNNNIREMSGN